LDQGTLARTAASPPGVHGTRHQHQHRRLHRSAAPEVDQATRDQRKQIIIDAMNAAGMVDANERAMFLAQLHHESQGFARMREKLNYSAARLREVFPNTFQSDADAQAVVARGADAIAERIYGHLAPLGNTTDGDGVKYIGRGFIQLTGRKMYAAAGRALGLDLENHPQLAEDPHNAARIAIWYWRDNSIGPNAQSGDVTRVTKAINRGLVGLAERTRLYQHYLANPAPAAPTGSSSGSTPTRTPTAPGRAPNAAGGRS
jgi:putative chitinase